jgi:hypothetical protein
MAAISAGGTRSAITPHTFIPRGWIFRSARTLAKRPTIPGISSSQPSASVRTISARRSGSNPGTTITLPPDISAASELSTAPMWYIGDQATKVSSGETPNSACVTRLRTIWARWLSTAPLGSPVVPLV